MTRAPLLDVLELERLDRDLFRAPRVETGKEHWHRFGGEVMAQALMAAVHTVEDRAPHSLHGYFLRRGLPEKDVILHVDRDRDGGSFSARRVVAVQDGEVIFSLAASFHAEEDSGEFQVPPPDDVTAPEETALSPSHGGPTDYFEARVLGVTEETDLNLPTRMWVRTKGELPDDPSVHACALTYLTDFGSGFGDVEIPHLTRGGPSLDHVLWFHNPIRIDEWVLLDMWPLRASSARGTYMGAVHDQADTLGGVFAQEALLREGMGPPPKASPAS